MAQQQQQVKVQMRKPFVMKNILEAVGDTPAVRLTRVPAAEGVKCNIVAKCEFFNAGGSVKDRIGLRMVADAEKSGRIKPGDTLIEPTSGNTGIGLALAAAIKGYRMIITLPEKMSQEKVNVLKALGAEIIRTPTEAAFDSPESHIGVAKRLQSEIPNSHILDQYTNVSNPLAHYDGTAEEIWAQTGGKIDMIVATAGTGGTIAGISKRLRELNPNIIVVGVDPEGSILAQPASLNGAISSYQVEGIGYDFIPDVLLNNGSRDYVSKWYKSNDTDSFRMARRLIREEGLLCGGSSGAAVDAAVKACRDFNLGPDKTCVVILSDSIRNYMSKHLVDEWMRENKFMAPLPLPEEWWVDRKVGELPLPTPISIHPSVKVKAAVELLKQQGYDQLPVVNAENDIIGVVTEGNLSALLLSGRVKDSDDVTKALYKQFKRVSLNTSLGELSRIFDKDHFALVVSSSKTYTSTNVSKQTTVINGIVTRIDLLNFITTAANNKSKM